MTTILHAQRETTTDDAVVQGDDLWLDGPTIERATGWTWKPEGLCHGDVCMPLPPAGADGAAGAARDAVVRDGRLNLAAMWRRSGQPVVHDAAGETWVFGAGAGERSAALATLQAPDFELPDLEGKVHRLSDWRGHKVFLATWASW